MFIHLTDFPYKPSSLFICLTFKLFQMTHVDSIIIQLLQLCVRITSNLVLLISTLLSISAFTEITSDNFPNSSSGCCLNVVFFFHLPRDSFFFFSSTVFGWPKFCLSCSPAKTKRKLTPPTPVNGYWFKFCSSLFQNYNAPSPAQLEKWISIDMQGCVRSRAIQK